MVFSKLFDFLRVHHPLLFGILLVFAEAFGSALLSEALVLCILVIVLLIKPEGLFGEKLRII